MSSWKLSPFFLFKLNEKVLTTILQDGRFYVFKNPVLYPGKTEDWKVLFNALKEGGQHEILIEGENTLLEVKNDVLVFDDRVQISTIPLTLDVIENLEMLMDYINVSGFGYFD